MRRLLDFAGGWGGDVKVSRPPRRDEQRWQGSPSPAVFFRSHNDAACFGDRTKVPTKYPTQSPTKRPTNFPTEAPAVACPIGTTYWAYGPTTTSAPPRRLVNNTATCLAPPYNIEVRPCRNNAPLSLDPTRPPVQIRLVNAAQQSVVHQSLEQRSSPFLLFGSAASTHKAPLLPNGRYTVGAKGAPEWGRLVFAQACPCPKGMKGRKGCMKRAE